MWRQLFVEKAALEELVEMECKDEGWKIVTCKSVPHNSYTFHLVTKDYEMYAILQAIVLANINYLKSLFNTRKMLFVGLDAVFADIKWNLWMIQWLEYSSLKPVFFFVHISS